MGDVFQLIGKVMPKPTHETWFMEGTLTWIIIMCLLKTIIPTWKNAWFITPTHDEALQIIENAHQFVSQFKK